MKKLIEANAASGRRRVSQVFSDFVELAALAFRNSVDLNGRDEREARYSQILSDYTIEEAARFPEMLARLVAKFESGFADVLGELYMSLDLGNENLGQFFTPYDVSLLTAQMTVGDFTEKLAGQEFITVNEPACGSGGMVIAVADTLRGAGINYQQKLHVTAQDIEITSVHMAFVQMTLLHIPGVVIHGNTLSLEQRDVWHTPAHVLGGWNFRLHNREHQHIAPVIPLRAPAPEENETNVTPIRPSIPDLEGIS